MGFLRKVFKNWFQEGAAGYYGAVVTEDAGLDTEIFRNRVWYRGRPAELAQFYAQTDDMAGNTSFWAASSGARVRKIHSGLPGMMVDALSDIVGGDFLGFRGDEERLRFWEDIARENGFPQLLKQAVRSALALGDGAFKLSYDPALSKRPVIEFYEADRVRFRYSRGRITEIVFLTPYEKDGRGLLLEEIYGMGGVDYRLLEDGHEAPLECLKEIAGLEPVGFAEGERGFMMAVPLIFDYSPRHPGRGRSLYESKLGAFDGLDEVLSQWIDALRDGRVVKYIPSNCLPRNPHTGEILPPNGFESRYVETDADLSEGAGRQIQVVQPDIRTDALTESYGCFLELALQGIIAPATLGIDLKKRDNAEAQREKEKATLYTRARIICVLQEVLPRLARTTVWMDDLLNGREAANFDVTAEFGEYAAPGFEAQLEAVGRAREMGVMSVEAAVDELYGDTWSKERKAAEAERLAKGSAAPRIN